MGVTELQQVMLKGTDYLVMWQYDPRRLDSRSTVDERREHGQPSPALLQEIIANLTTRYGPTEFNFEQRRSGDCCRKRKTTSSAA